MQENGENYEKDVKNRYFFMFVYVWFMPATCISAKSNAITPYTANDFPNGNSGEEIEETGEMQRIKNKENAYIEMDTAYAKKAISFRTVPTYVLWTFCLHAIQNLSPKTIAVKYSSPAFANTIRYQEYDSFGEGYAGTLLFMSSKLTGEHSYTATYFGYLIRKQ